MTTPEGDPLIPFTRMPRLNVIPTRRGDTRLHVPTVFRWTPTGVRGVRLRTTMAGGQRCTTLAALHAFFAAVDAAGKPPSDRPPAARSTPSRSSVDADLDRLGL